MAAQPPDDLERRITESLHDRAADVTPSSGLWTRVETTVNRRTRLTWGLAAAGLAAVTAAAVIVVPALFDDEQGVIVDQPTETPTSATDNPTGVPTPSPSPTNANDDPTPDEGPSADAILATDGEDLFRVGLDGTRGDTLYEGDRNDERSLVSFSIRPGSTEAVLDAIVLFGGEGGSRFFHLRLFDGQSTMTELADQYQPTAAALAVPTRPAFSPDGRHVAWVEVSADEYAAGPILKTIGWTDEGPGTGNAADDNAGFGLTDLPNQAYRVEDWAWDVDGTETSGDLVLRAADMIETVLVSIDRQSDGALAVPRTSATLLPGAVVDWAETGSAEMPIVHELQVMSDGSQDAEGVQWRLISAYEDGEVTTVLDLGSTADPGAGWMDAVDELVLAGHGTTAVLVEQGTVTPLQVAMTFGALIPPG